MSAIAPRGLKWTYEDYARLPEDGLRHEIIAGEHFENPSPGTQHQHVSKRLQYQLYERSGVSEYWIVDPFEQQVEQWILRDGKYQLAPRSHVVRLSFVSDVEVDFETVW